MRVTALAFLIALAACGSETKPGGKSSSAEDDRTASSAPASAEPSLSAPNKSPPPSKKEPDKLTSAIRENVATGAAKDGAAFEARMFVSKLTPADNVHLALRFKLDKPLEKDDPLRKATMDAGQLARSLRFEISSPGGKTTLETGEELGQGQLGIGSFDTELTLDGRGVSQFGKTAAWKKPAPDVFSKPGKYGVAITGKLEMGDRTVAISLQPLEFEIVEAGPSMRTLAELSRTAADLVQKKKTLGKAPQSFTAVIDDVDGNRWHRYQVDSEGNTSHGRYDVEVIEVLLDPAGNELNYDSFLHFTCVAQGVTIATPTGNVPVEKLAMGDRVLSYDVATRTKGIALVEHVNAAHADRLIRLGDLLVTGAHPVFVGGRFELAQNLAPASEMLSVDLTTKLFDPVAVELPGTVYELTIGEPHTYFAGGLLVHNKAAYEPVGGQQQAWRGWFYRRAVRR